VARALTVVSPEGQSVCRRRLRDPQTGRGGFHLSCPLEDLDVSSGSGGSRILVRVPSTARQFRSPMHRLERRGPTAAWRGEVRALLERRVPYIRVYEETGDADRRLEFREAIVRLIEEGYAGAVVATATGNRYAAAALPDAIAATVDLDALETDYRAWFVAAGVDHADPGTLNPPLEELSAAIQTLRDACYSHFVLSDTDLVPSTDVRGSIVRGIVVGEDPAQTCASLLAHITGDTRLWRSAR
jgi:hypothetical protein